MYEEKGINGFGYDPVFFVDEKNCSMAELSKDDKALVSHRGKALRLILDWIINNAR